MDVVAMLLESRYATTSGGHLDLRTVDVRPLDGVSADQMDGHLLLDATPRHVVNTQLCLSFPAAVVMLHSDATTRKG